MEDQLSPEERDVLLKIARQAMEAAVRGQLQPELNAAGLPARLLSPGATFVTLTVGGVLRGCIGALEAHHPLAEDVREHAVAAALEDYRFPPVHPSELPEILIEISRLTRPQLLEYETTEQLPGLLRRGVDGVIMRDGLRRATFLPQVWEKLPDPEMFLAHLCQKMGAPSNLWRVKKLQVAIYQVEEFHE